MALYVKASEILEQAEGKLGCVKNLVYNSKYKNVKQLYALVCGVLKHSAVLEDIVSKSRLLKDDKKLKPHMAKLLVYDYVFGKGLKCGGHWKLLMRKNHGQLNSIVARMKVSRHLSSNRELLSSFQEAADDTGRQIPRYCRVNVLRSSMHDVMDYFKRHGHTYLGKARSVKDLERLKNNEFLTDLHLPDVLAFAHGTDFHDHELYRCGNIILQDKASCLPAFLLAPTPGAHVMDCCAAPGNKTSQLAAIMKNKGKIFAVDRDEARLATASTQLLRAGVTCHVLLHTDFLQLDPHDPRFRDVRFLLLDPSCSGSGMLNRHVGQVDEEKVSPDRLAALSGFQYLALRHALSFPRAQRVVYSTCSLHLQENEEVVQDVLKHFENSFRLVDPLPDWPHRGEGTFPGAALCLRASAHSDLTSGFFVAVFERVEQSPLK
uniref:28S rRNA (cytosine-C(5))-methyltransferase isoform X1 n=2 Tax=Myxine glutinosa TaxID=7769 RepID=UPI00358FC8ED